MGAIEVYSSGVTLLRPVIVSAAKPSIRIVIILRGDLAYLPEGEWQQAAAAISSARIVDVSVHLPAVLLFAP